MTAKKFYIVTSDDFTFAGQQAIYLQELGVDVSIITKPSNKRTLHKKLSIAVGWMYGVLVYVYLNSLNKRKLNKIIITISNEDELTNIVRREQNSIFVLINYESIIKSKELLNNKNVLNIHPSVLPSYRGLGPIFWTFLNIQEGHKANYGWTAHKLSAEIDEGEIVYQKMITIDNVKNLWSVYRSVYFDKDIALLIANIENTMFDHKSMLIKNSYFKSPTLLDALKLLRIQKNRIGEILRYIINGGIIGLFSWIVQYVIYKSLIIQKMVAEDAIVFSIYIAFIMALLLNFVLQSKFVFRKSGSFLKFIIVNLLAISIVANFSRLIIKILKQNEIEAFIIFAYPIAALTLAPVVYLIKSKIVFNKGP